MDGNQGQLGLALMTDTSTVPAVPTITLRTKGFLDPMSKPIMTEENATVGNRFGAGRMFQGNASDGRQLQATATLRDLPLLLTAILAAPDGTGLITPRPNSYSALAPGQPIAAYQKYPTKNAIFPATQLSALTITIASRQNVDISATLNVAYIDTGATMPVFPPLVATGVLQFLHFYIKIGTKVYAPESGSIEISQEMQVEDGARGLDDAKKAYIIGWSLNGSLKAKLGFVLSESGGAVGTGSLAELIDKTVPDPATGLRPTQTVEAGFKIGTDEIKFTFPNAELEMDSSPTGLGRLTVGFGATSRDIGTPPVLVNVPVTP